MADYNTKTIIDSIVLQAKDPSLDRDLVLEYVQRTQDEVLGRSRFKFSEDAVEVQLSADSFTYDYECDHQQILQLVLIDYTTTLPTIYQPHYISSNEFFELYPSPADNVKNPPFNFTDFKGQIWFPAPLNKKYTLKMRYLERPKRLTDATTSKPLIPIEFKNILIKGGLSGVEQFRENFDIAGVYMRSVEDLLDDMLGRYSPRKVGPGVARTRGLSFGNTPNYYGNGGISNGPF